MEVLHYGCALFAFWAILCRATRMDKYTPLLAKVQHGVVMLLATSSIPIIRQYIGLPEDWEPASLALALCVYFVADARGRVAHNQRREFL